MLQPWARKLHEC